MSLAPSRYPSLCSSPPLPTSSVQAKQIPLFLSQNIHFLSRNCSFLSTSTIFSNTLLPNPSNSILKASETEPQTSKPAGSGSGSEADKTGKFSVGDKVIATSAVFGTEIWPAAEYGRTMYTIRQRIGPLLMKMQKRYGNMDYTGELTEKEIIRAERNSGVISNRVREIQMQNYLRKKEQKEQREKDLREGLQLYKNAKYEEALEKFESMLGSKPDPTEAAVASYNVACCYSKLNQLQAGLSALQDAMEAGFEDFKRIRTDPDLSNLRTSEEFETLVKRFDESFINENAINAIKSLFGFNKK
ncbi:hypothetical protein OIU77_026328 [Salix suchowensis]|uniref:Uncharacterized protein n=1 Tax=Salix suchowensis TaxID=1278906 RepID=A0ABQ9BKR2_9ROSI|nr:hypothetical protein OIU77_026328 [Salix suchowensis]